MATSKRKDVTVGNREHIAKKRKSLPELKKNKSVNVEKHFRKELFQEQVVSDHKHKYTASQPYRYGVIENVIDDGLLRKVREEILENVSFTPKETDIYKIQQSGDLTNLDGLPKHEQKQLANLMVLRDALYSPKFRQYLSDITGCGPLSGTKTDMAVNIYTVGSHLLCHDDVIGTRKVSYILYLLDPEKEWHPHWGGALRLYPTRKLPNDMLNGENSVANRVNVPMPDPTVSVAPKWNQLSFFEVQPGHSFHDVEEVYDGQGSDKRDRVRMAISGWFHIPQEGEVGYIANQEKEQAQQSSLAQLEAKSTIHDLPSTDNTPYEQHDGSAEEGILTEEDCEFLLKFMAPHYLSPDTVESIQTEFETECAIRLDDILSKKFSKELFDFISAQDGLPYARNHLKDVAPQWEVARPPHKRRFCFMLPTAKAPLSSPLIRVMRELLPSLAFRKWLTLATGLTLMSHDIKARRFRRGYDYTLGEGYPDKDQEEDATRLELTLGMSPDKGWEEEEDQAEEAKVDGVIRKRRAEQDGFGGHETWTYNDDEDDAHDKSKKVADPAIYKAAEDEDDNIAFTMAPGWNRLSLVLRDKGTQRFVKYVSLQAPGDRWDVVGAYEVENGEDSDDEGDDEKDDDIVGNEDGEDSEKEAAN